MEGIKQKTLLQAVKMLNGLGVDYKIIADDQEFGNLEVKPKENSGRAPRGTYSDTYKPMLERAEIGEVVTINGGHDPERMRSSVTGFANRVFGAGNYVTSVTNGMVEFMRLE